MSDAPAGLINAYVVGVDYAPPDAEPAPVVEEDGGGKPPKAKAEPAHAPAPPPPAQAAATKPSK